MAAAARFNRDALGHLLRQQAGVLSRSQALACDMPPHTIRHRIRPGGPWQRLLPGVYIASTGSPTQAQKEIAASLYAGRDSVLTGLTALGRHKLGVAAPVKISVLVPVGRPHRSQTFMRVWPTTRMPAQVCFEGPVQFALPARAVADAARELGSFREYRGLVADAVQQRLCRIDHLADELRRGPVRHSLWLRRALGEVAGGIRSGAEGDFRDLLRRAGLPMPMFNARLYLGQRLIAVADAWWPEAGVAAEVESRAWHLSPEDWEGTLRRSARLSAAGIIVVHVTPGQIRQEPARVAADIGAALRAGRARGRPGVRAQPAG